MKHERCEFCREKDRLFGMGIAIGGLLWVFFAAIVFDYAQHFISNSLGI